MEAGKFTAQGNGLSIFDAAASFQQAVIDVLATKTIAAARDLKVNQILVSGGVAANKHLRKQLLDNSPIPVLVPKISLCTDNAAMIAACGYFHFKNGTVSGLDMDAVPGLKLA